MSGPFVYKPSAAEHPSYPTRWRESPYFHPSPRVATIPFIPDISLFPPSPYSNHNSPYNRDIPLPPEDPTTPNQREIPLPPDDSFAFSNRGPWDELYKPAWDNGVPRKRRVSFKDDRNSNAWPGLPPAGLFSPPSGHHRRKSEGPAWPGMPPEGLLPPVIGNNRRHSFGAYHDQRPFVQPDLVLHPWINAKFPRTDFYFDLSLPEYMPLQIYGNEESGYLPDEILLQPATYPPVTRLKIIFGPFPEWPLIIQLDPLRSPLGYELPPITVEQVLGSVYDHLHHCVTEEQSRQLRLSRRGQTQVAEAFTVRCAALPHSLYAEREKGMKRVDLLLGKHKMVGLLHLGLEDGMDVMQLVVT